jgi:hypothetical protein
MPGGDRTGPMGMGPVTGRAAGFCAGFGMPGFANPVPGRGFGMGCGWGRGAGGRGFGGGGGRRGWRHWFNASVVPGWMGFGWAGAPPAPAPEAEKRFLEGQAEALQAELDALKKRMAELETGKQTNA